MSEENKAALAKKVYDALCSAIDNRKWKYERKDEELIVHFAVGGDDLPMSFILIIDADRQLIRLLSPIPFKISENKRMEGAIATCSATYGLADGSFDYDLSDGQIVFRMTASYRESEIGEELFQYMISCACATVDMYNDKFFALDKGIMSIDDFIEDK